MTTDDNESRANLSTPKVLDTSSLRRKKLFQLDSEEE